MRKPIRRRHFSRPKRRRYLKAVVADRGGNIFDLDEYAAVGMAGPEMLPLTVGETCEMPFGGELMLLPDRKPVVYDPESERMVMLHENPYAPGEPVYPVAAFNSPGYVQAYVSAYAETGEEPPLPLFSYGAVGWSAGRFRSPLIRVDDEPRQDLRLMPVEKVREGVERMRGELPENRLRKHLERCALEYGCPAGKNFFLQRYEAPLPTSRRCNARCLGCLSLQSGDAIHCSQERIDFTPTPAEIAGVALAHIRRVERSVVSFGQGCEGDPLLAAEAIGPAIERIRAATDAGTINMNTNGSLPEVLETLFDTGLDAIRVSINSVREPCYTAYFRPQGYAFNDVVRSIDLALERGKFVAINYLNCPGFTDTPEEMEALLQFREAHPFQMIQWRNLNYDPIRYWAAMNRAAPHGSPLGMKNLLQTVRGVFPDMIFGYFNPPKERWRTTPVDGASSL